MLTTKTAVGFGLAGLLEATMLVTIAAPASVAEGAAVSDPRPNIILITSDDQRANDLAVMAQTQRLLAGRGTTFDRAYAPFPLCAPSRASILTGQYAHNHGVLGNGGGRHPLGGVADFDDTSTVATWLQDAGYETALVGKYINHYGEVDPTVIPPGWDDWHASVGEGANYFAAALNENGVVNEYRGVYTTDLTADIATDVITEHAASDAPFFLWASFYAPHTGGPVEADDPPKLNTPAVAPRHQDAFAGEPLPKDPSYNEADVSDKPEYVRDRRLISPSLEANLTELNQQRWESLLALDEGIAKMMKSLEESGEIENTIVVFTSDNGYLLGEHRIPAGKTVPYEPASQLPLIVTGPGFPAGVVRTQPVALIDLAPTFVEAARATAELPIDGVSLRRAARDPRVGSERTLVIEAGPLVEDGPWLYRGLHSSDYVYVEYEETGEVELYDMVNDPYQLVNLAYQPTEPSRELIAQMAARLDVLYDCVGAACRR